MVRAATVTKELVVFSIFSYVCMNADALRREEHLNPLKLKFQADVSAGSELRSSARASCHSHLPHPCPCLLPEPALQPQAVSQSPEVLLTR